MNNFIDNTLLLENSNDIIINIDYNGTIKYVNPKFYSITFYSSQNVINKNIIDFFHKKEIKHANDYFDNIENNEKVIKKSFRFSKANDDWCWLSAKIINNTDNKSITIIAIEQSETKIVDYKYRQLLNNSPDLIIIHDRENILFINEKGLKLLEYKSYDEIIGEPIMTLIHDEYKEFVKERIENKDDILTYHYPVIEKYITKNGNEIYVELFAVTIDFNEIDAVQIIARDITKRKIAENKLSETELKFKHLVEQSSDGIVIIDNIGNILTWNSSLEKITGIKYNRVFGKKLWEIDYQFIEEIKNINSEIVKNWFFEFINSKELSNNKTFTQNFNNGNDILKIEVSTFPIHSNNNIFIGFIARDITEFIKVKENFNKSDELFRALMNLSPDIISIIKQDRTLNYISPAVTKIHGYQINELIGKNITNYIHDEDKDILLYKFNELLNSTRDTITVQYRFKNIDNSYCWMEAVAINQTKNQFINGIIVISRDISDRKKIEEELIQSSTQYKSLIENSPIPVAVHSEGNIIFANQAAIELMGGKKLDDFFGMNIWSFVDKDYHDITKKRVDNIYYNQKSAPKKEAIFKTLKGERIFIEAAGSFILFDGKPSSQVVLYDLTDRKKAEIALIENEEKFRSLVQQSGDGIIIVDENGKIIEWNYSQEKITGLKALSTIGQFIWDIQFETIPYDKKNELTKEKIKKAILYSLKNSENRYFYNVSETKIKLKDNTEKYIQVSVFPINLSDRNMIGYISRDITKAKEYEEKLKNSMLFAEEANQAKSKFLANMSHEIRTPMNGILGFTEVLLDIESDPKKTEMLSLIRTSGETLLKLINDILDLSKVEAGKISIINKEFNLTNLIENTVKSFEIVAHKKNLKLIFINHNEFDGFVLSDSLRLKQIIANLLSNALKFTFRGEVKVELFTKVNDNILESKIIVKDTGIGVAADKIEKIFEEFYQNSDTEKYKGTGLGLSITKKLVEMMNGSIKLKSEIDIGSEFIVNINFELTNSNYIHKEIVENKKTENIPGVKILVAEDDLTNQHLISAIAKSRKWNVDIVENGKLAVEKYQNNNYDLILMDIQMPIMTGIEATISIREYEKNIGKHTPIIACTAYAMINDKTKCLSAGMDEYISKPINFNELNKIIDKYQKK